MQLEDWLDDLCVRFIINLPPEELGSVERICFQVEEAQWFYEDFIRPLDPSLPSLSLKAFSLRIFQHCPLFSQWSAQHHTTAFAEFLAYKQRVPVRGAIMLNENMDEVVLVKGWKKGANWSFPRGKINKDEHDLDCAVREVYEETGFDITAAGLVKPEREMKYIEVTMREQHMRLYVFRGVPKETHFEPRTRKEISKIEWYKLNDLPTLRKKNHHDGHDDNVSVNANKFYMVAPFLNPLKKWIAQQRKRERHNSNLAAPPVFADESATEHDTESYMPAMTYSIQSPQVPSSLPEVMMTQQQHHVQDPSSHLKELLKIGPHVPGPNPEPTAAQLGPSDLAKSNALLALLRGGPTAEQAHHSSTSYQSGPVQRHVPEAVQPPSMTGKPIQSETDRSKQPQLLEQLFAGAQKSTHFDRSIDRSESIKPQQTLLPYQNTGDPQLTNETPPSTSGGMIPSASALPKLTHHTRTLLDAFKTGPLGQSQSQPTQQARLPQLPATAQTLLAAFNSSRPQPTFTNEAPPTLSKTQQPVEMAPPTPKNPSVTQQLAGDSIRTAAHEGNNTTNPLFGTSSSLLDLFKRHPDADTAAKGVDNTEQQSVPVELAATPVTATAPVQNQTDLMTSLFKQNDGKAVQKARRSPINKAGQTGATIDTPLHQPQFEGIVKSPSAADQTLRRGSPASNRTLFDPKQSVPLKILSRHEDNAKPPRSPRQHKSQAVAPSPKRNAQPKEKPFQPQILRRPQMTDIQSASSPSPTTVLTENPPTSHREATSRDGFVLDTKASIILDSPQRATSPANVSEPRKSPQPNAQTDLHKQSLLSLFGNPSASSPMGSKTQISQTLSIQPGIASPLHDSQPQSQIVSPILGGYQPISTKSRVGSIGSISVQSTAPDLNHSYREQNLSPVGDGAGSTRSSGRVPQGPFRPEDGRIVPVPKRQTTADDKAFLLGYLGRIASQEGNG